MPDTADDNRHARVRVGGYRPDFYSFWNIIGYTGDLNDNPTVYFRYRNEVGHITQFHEDPRNIGRQEVMDVTGLEYRIENVEDEDGNLKCQETVGQGGMRLVAHPSRGKFTSAARLDMNKLYSLGEAIYRFPDKKTIPRSG